MYLIKRRGRQENLKLKIAQSFKGLRRTPPEELSRPLHPRYLLLQVLYVVNIVFNILAVDIVKSYKENVDDDIDYNREQLLIFHYICLVFGVVTVLSSAIFLIKMSSEDWVQFMVKWNVVRCLFAFIAIIYVCAEMDHIITVAISSVLLVIDLCASTYFTGVMSSYIKQMEDPRGQIYSSHENREPSVYLVSHKTSSQTENKVDNVNELSTFPPQLPEKENTSIQRETTGTINIAVDVETRKDATEEMNLNSVPATNDNITRTVNIPETENSSSTTTNDEGGDPNNTHEKDNELKERRTSTDLETTKPDNNDSDNDTRDKTDKEKSSTDINLTEETEDVPAGIDIQAKVESEKREIQKPENEVDSDIQESDRNLTEDSEKSSEVKGIENPAVDVGETEPPSVVIVPASPDTT